MRSRFFLVLVLLLITGSATVAQTTAFTYQGKLADNGNPATGHYDFQFSLFDASSGGTQQGTPQTAANILVTNGIFAVTLDFVNCSGCSCPTCFNGGPRFLAIAVRPTGGGSYTPLTDRQPITSTPYAVKSMSAANATTADGLSVACVNCVTSSQILSVNGSAVTGTIPVASVPDLGASYIKNTTSPQSSSNFNISGTGTADIFSAATQYNVGSNRALTVTGLGNSNTFVGVLAGNMNPSGSFNSFFGVSSGRFATTGDNNSFYGGGSGEFNQGSDNAFFGAFTGSDNTIGSRNSFFGRVAGNLNTEGNDNNFFGFQAGALNSMGSNNTFLGTIAGVNNTTGSRNTLVGDRAAVATGNLSNTTALGANAQVSQSNSLVLGSINGVNGANADTSVGIGTTAPSQRLHVVGNGLFTGNLTVNGTLNATLPTGSANYIQNTTSQQAGNFNISNNGTAGGTLSANIVNATTQYNIGGQRLLITSGLDNLIAGVGAGVANAGGFNTFFGSGTGINNTGDDNCFFGDAAGQNNTTGANNTFLGEAAGLSNTTENSNSFIGAGANGAAGITNATAIGALAQVTQSNSLVLGAINGVNGCDPNFGVGCHSVNVGIGTTAPTFKLTVSDSSNTGLRVATATAGGTVASFGGSGAFEIDSPGTAGGRFRVAENGSTTVGISGVGGDLTVFGSTLLNTVTIANGATLNVLGAAGSTSLCRNASAQISTCSSSFRYKQNIHPFGSGLALLNRLRPVTFNWKANNEPDLGLVAEEVAKVEPLLATHNDKGEVEGVKYDRINVVLINAIKEQQAQINQQHGQIKEQQQEIETLKQQQQEVGALKAIVCTDHPAAAICKSR